MQTMLSWVTMFGLFELVGCGGLLEDAGASQSAIAGSDFAVLNGPDTPSTQTVKRGSGTLFDITLESLNGFDAVVTFSATGMPIKTTSGFSVRTIAGSGDTTFDIQTIKPAHDPGGIGTPPGTYALTITGTSGELSHSVDVTLIVR